LTNTQPDSGSARGGAWWVAQLGAWTGAAISAALTWRSLSAGGALPGCGPGGACGEVLASVWSSWRGVPVAAAALVTYLAIAISLVGSMRRWKAVVQLGGAALLLAAAGWFVFIQLAVLGALCLWCTAAHAIGVATATALLVRLAVRGPSARDAGSDAERAWTVSSASNTDSTARRGSDSPAGPAQDEAAGQGRAGRSGELAEASVGQAAARREPPALSPLGAASTLLLTLLLFGGYAMDKAWRPEAGAGPSAAVQRRAGNGNFDHGAGADRVVALLDGAVRLRPHALPILGSPAAEHVLVALYDHNCPHCRVLHEQLHAAVQRYGRSRLACVMLATPLNDRCNDAVEGVEPRFETSCELARLSIAVWRLRPDAFERFDAFLTREPTPSPEEARRLAKTLADPQRIEGELSGEPVGSRLRKNVRLYELLEAGSLPKLIYGSSIAHGRFPDEAALFAELERELGVGPPDS